MAKQLMLCCAVLRRQTKRPEFRLCGRPQDGETLREADFMQCAAPKVSDHQNTSGQRRRMAELDVKPGWDKHRRVRNPGRNVR